MNHVFPPTLHAGLVTSSLALTTLCAEILTHASEASVAVFLDCCRDYTAGTDAAAPIARPVPPYVGC